MYVCMCVCMSVCSSVYGELIMFFHVFEKHIEGESVWLKLGFSTMQF